MVCRGMAYAQSVLSRLVSDAKSLVSEHMSVHLLCEFSCQVYMSSCSQLTGCLTIILPCALLFVWLVVCLFVCLSVCLPVCLFPCLCLFVFECTQGIPLYHRCSHQRGYKVAQPHEWVQKLGKFLSAAGSVVSLAAAIAGYLSLSFPPSLSVSLFIHSSLFLHACTRVCVVCFVVVR